MARIPYARDEDFTDAISAQLSDRPALNLYQMLPRLGEPAALGFLRLGRALLREGTLDPRVRELAILRTGHLCEASYEVHQHRRLARSIGVSEEKIAAVADDRPADVFSDLERAVLEYTDDVVIRVKSSDETFAHVHGFLGDARTGELTLLIGFYSMVSRLLENLEIDIEEVAPATQ